MSVQQYFAQINENNIVTAVHVVDAQFMAENPDRYPGTWVETFFDVPGKTYAGIGYTYHFDTEDFTSPLAHRDPIIPA